MSNILKVSLILLLLLQVILIINSVKKKKFSIKYASLWIFLLTLMAIIVIFPELVFIMAKFMGFEKASNMVFLLGFFFLFYIIFTLTASISIQNEKIKLLVQEVSLLKEKIEINDKK